jgi:site-specific DNA recombinase
MNNQARLLTLVAAISGKTVMEHPEAKRMLADLKRGHVTALIFSKLARLSRNLREVQDFGDLFRQYNADLISLNESIDTSSAGGRMFFHLLGVFAQWEREEISERINASFLTRAKLGKLLNKNVPYGYQAEDGKMLLHPDEAPIRREAYELFLANRRKLTVARILNGKGYRTRNNCLWHEVQIHNILTDPSAKGVHIFNRAKRNGSWKGTPKPESEWGRIACEPIVSEELWTEVNRILEEEHKTYRRRGRMPTQTFSNLTWCKCGTKMYCRTDSPKYLCRACNNKIPIADLEAIFHDELKAFFADSQKIASHMVSASKTLAEKEATLQSLGASIQKVREEMNQTHRLYIEGQITAQGFGQYYKPAEERLNQMLAELPKLQAEVDLLKVNRLSAEDVMAEAKTLYDRWPKLPIDERRKIAEAVCEKIVIGNGEIDITLSYLPSSEELCKSQTQLNPV